MIIVIIFRCPQCPVPQGVVVAYRRNLLGERAVQDGGPRPRGARAARAGCCQERFPVQDMGASAAPPPPAAAYDVTIAQKLMRRARPAGRRLALRGRVGGRHDDWEGIHGLGGRAPVRRRVVGEQMQRQRQENPNLPAHGSLSARRAQQGLHRVRGDWGTRARLRPAHSHAALGARARSVGGGLKCAACGGCRGRVQQILGRAVACVTRCWCEALTCGNAGVLTYKDGRRYEGEYKLDKMHGRGVYVWAEGARYEGEYREDKKNGRGVQTWPSGARYEGEYVDSMQTGYGLMTWADGRRYEGYWVNSKCTGLGVLAHKDGRRYEGEYVNDKMQGKGVYTWANRAKYDGEYKDNKKNGRGIHTWPDGSMYEGEYVEGKAAQPSHTAKCMHARVEPAPCLLAAACAARRSIK